MINKVLLIDDDEITLMICKMVIKYEAFADDVLTFKNGQEGINYFQELETDKKQQVPELILLDINMPVMNGWEFLEEFENRFLTKFPNVNIYILSSSVDPLDIRQSKIYSNVIGFINKPLTPERIDEIKENEKLSHYFLPTKSR